MKTLILLIFCLMMPCAYAQTTPDVSIVATVTAAVNAAASGKIMPTALSWLASFMMVQFILTNIGLLKSGADIEAVFGKLITSLIWFGFCVYVLNNGPDFIDTVGTGIFSTFASSLPTPASVILSTLALCTTIIIGIAAVGTSIAGVGNSSIAMVLVYVLFIIFAVGMYLAVKIIMIQLELGLIVMLAPISFALLGLNAFKDQGIAPFKSLLSLAYRMILLGIIFSAFSNVVGVAKTQLVAISWSNPLQWGTMLNIFFSMTCAFPIIAYLIYKSDSIAASLAGGSSSMGPGDVVAAAAMGAATGAAAASGAATLAGVGKAGPPMSEVMKDMRGGGSVSNASSGSGTGGGTGTHMDSPERGPVASVGPTFETNKYGAPIKTESPAGSAMRNDGGTMEQEQAAANHSSTSESPTGSAAKAGIGGDGQTPMEQAGQKNKSSFSDDLHRAAGHLSQEKAATHVSINTNPQD